MYLCGPMKRFFKKDKKYKTGFAFSGGGAKGAAHCGALQALYEFGVKADIVAGTSAGSRYLPCSW